MRIIKTERVNCACIQFRTFACGTRFSTTEPKTMESYALCIVLHIRDFFKLTFIRTSLKTSFKNSHHLFRSYYNARAAIYVSEWYLTICLPEVVEEIRKTNRQCRIILRHDNASCHTSAEATRFLEGQKIELTSYPPYSPDLAPKNFYLFPSVKNKLRGQHFSSREETVDALKTTVSETPQSE
ncbi:Mariner Mos1 transposase [Eumeta japonica]|uniref:Mariner Mos1 transposase n=1 Tax=Eumeta variegata TaxID=151549 RepID=A0A4C1ZNE2_EUMVA|nr:Mariner Mos1 transposase [Eumeta japonica]